MLERVDARRTDQEQHRQCACLIGKTGGEVHLYDTEALTDLVREPCQLGRLARTSRTTEQYLHARRALGQQELGGEVLIGRGLTFGIEIGDLIEGELPLRVDHAQLRLPPAQQFGPSGHGPKHASRAPAPERCPPRPLCQVVTVGPTQRHPGDVRMSWPGPSD